MQKRGLKNTDGPLPRVSTYATHACVAQSDPIALLRKFAAEKREIVEDDDRLVFGDYACSKTHGTNLKI